MTAPLKVVPEAPHGRDDCKIAIHGLSYTYVTRAGETLALDNLGFSVREGEFCSIVGPSGCGKSTLLSILSGLLEPTEGQVLLEVVRFWGTNGKLGFFLKFDIFFYWGTVLHNAELGL
jgi:NitT/TauT family transport system ATP-binding protein